jgi:predicted nucleotidyltransferase component of viral defense system
MLQLDYIKNFYPEFIQNRGLQKFMVKEYLLLLILDYLTTTSFIRKIVFIGGTNLRLTKGIDRFSEDLDFDCKDLSSEEFIKMTDGVGLFLKRYGFSIEIRDKYNEKLKAFRRSIYFPELLFELGLSGYRQERFLIKIESQDQKISYKRKMAIIKGCGLYFSFPVPTDEVLCSMKISALLSRKKGRDFYDVMFLMEQTPPDFNFLSARHNITNMKELKGAFNNILQTVDLSHKVKDFEHLVFQKDKAQKILHFKDFVKNM